MGEDEASITNIPAFHRSKIPKVIIVYFFTVHI
jgi:hypothetical protein